MKRATFFSTLIFSVLAYAAGAQTFGDGLVINEFMASNDSLSGIVDPNGQTEDWIEFYNNGNSTLNLEGFFLSDKPDNPQKWSFPAGASIEPDGYLIVWCDEDGSQPELHANFKLSKDGEFIILSNPFGEVLDSLTFGPQETNVAAARRPNGTGNFVMQSPTFGYNNDEATAVIERLSGRWKLAPNPVSTLLSLNWQGDDRPQLRSIEVINYAGQLVKRLSVSAEIDTHDLLPGLYLLRLNTEKGFFVERFVKY